MRTDELRYPECGSGDLAVEQLMFAPAYAALDEEGLWQVRFDRAALSPGETDREPVLCGECGACHEELDVLDASGLLEGEDDLAQMGGEV